MPDPEKTQEQLEEDINASIRDEAYAEIDGTKEKLPETEEEDEDLDFNFGDEEEEAENKDSEEEPKKEADPDALVIEEENKDAETETINDEQEVTDVNLEELAKKYSVTVEEAESILKQQKHYKNDPNELAKALLNSQRGYSKLEKDFKALKEQADSPVLQEVSTKDVKQHILEMKHIIDGRCFTQDDIVTEYCRLHPELTEDLEDSKVFELACRDIRDATNKERKSKEESVPTNARIRRSELKASIVDQIPEKYLSELKDSLDIVDDRLLLSDKFDLKGLAAVIKGKYYDADIEKAKKDGYAEGLKKGQEKSKLITPPMGNSGSGNKGASSNVVSFTQAQNERMESMFRSTGMSAKEKRIAFIVINPEQFDEKVVKWAEKNENGG